MYIKLFSVGTLEFLRYKYVKRITDDINYCGISIYSSLLITKLPSSTVSRHDSHESLPGLGIDDETAAKRGKQRPIVYHARDEERAGGGEGRERANERASERDSNPRIYEWYIRGE